MKTITTTKNSLGTGFMYPALLIAALFILFASIQDASAAALTRSLDVGSTGADVTSLQSFLALDASIYPEKLVTGYFGSLTQSAVQRFQTVQGIVSSGSPLTTGYGRVGPTTRTRINTLMGGETSASWDTVPILSAPAVQTTGTSATITWFTNEATKGQVYLDTSSIRSDEATGPGQMPYISGTLYLDSNGALMTNHSVMIQNLQPNTDYNFVVRAIDSGNNISITLSRSFRTNQ